MTGVTPTTRFPVTIVQSMNGSRVLGSLSVTVPPGHSVMYIMIHVLAPPTHTVPLGHGPSHSTHSPLID